MTRSLTARYKMGCKTSTVCSMTFAELLCNFTHLHFRTMSSYFAFFFLMVSVVTIQRCSAQGDCWWTGCQPGDWAVVGCDHYGREERGTKPCSDGRGVAGFKYNCCAKSGGGGGGAGGGGGDGGEGGEENYEDEGGDQVQGNPIITGLGQWFTNRLTQGLNRRFGGSSGNTDYQQYGDE